MDEHGSERGVCGILHRAPAPLDNGEIRGAVNQGTYLDFDQHRLRRLSSYWMVSEGGGCRGKGLMADAKAERRFPYKLFPTRDSDMTMSRDKPVELLACRRVPTSLPRVLSFLIWSSESVATCRSSTDIEG